DDDDEDSVIENLPDVDLEDDDEPISTEDDNTFLETDDDDDEIGIDVPLEKDDE
ncbi:MAG: TIGR02300 family protein, partial [Roseibium sp.]|nr:TIGR02300 family protein [Roseibium sp.]